MENIKVAQSDMRNGYGHGSIGVLVSGMVWLTASFVANFYSPKQAIFTLIIGGMFIFPLAMLVGKIFGVAGQHKEGNPLGKLAMEGTIWMIMCIPIAYLLSLTRQEWFFQAMLLIIAGRYLTFASIYGMRIYWLLGAVLCLMAYTLFILGLGVMISALTGGLVEVVFAIIIFLKYKGKKTNP